MGHHMLFRVSANNDFTIQYRFLLTEGIVNINHSSCYFTAYQNCFQVKKAAPGVRERRLGDQMLQFIDCI
jgi:hypothetical protein